MNLFNRIVTILLLLTLIPIVTVGLIVPRETIELLRDGLDQLERELDPSSSTGRLMVNVALVLLIDGLLVFLLYWQVRRPSVDAVPVLQVKEGQAQIAIDSIVERLKYQVDRLPGVLEVQPQVVAHRRGVRVALDVEAEANVGMPAMVAEISALVRKVVEDEMGLQLKGKPKLNLHTVAYPESVAGHPPEALTLGGAVASDVPKTEDEPMPYEFGNLGLTVLDEDAVGDREDEPGSVVTTD